MIASNNVDNLNERRIIGAVNMLKSTASSMRINVAQAKTKENIHPIFLLELSEELFDVVERIGKEYENSSKPNSLPNYIVLLIKQHCTN